MNFEPSNFAYCTCSKFLTAKGNNSWSCPFIDRKLQSTCLFIFETTKTFTNISQLISNKQTRLNSNVSLLCKNIGFDPSLPARFMRVTKNANNWAFDRFLLYFAVFLEQDCSSLSSLKLCLVFKWHERLVDSSLQENFFEQLWHVAWSSTWEKYSQTLDYYLPFCVYIQYDCMNVRPLLLKLD